MIEFLRESNAIEGVYDDDSMVQALLAWKYLVGCKKLTPGVIMKMHKILMLNHNLLPSEKGYLRTVPVWIGSRQGMHHLQIREAIEMWCLNANDLVENGRNKLEGNAEFLAQEIQRQHVGYEKIHPFVDGNGRTGRMLMNWQRLKAKLPMLVIHEGAEQREYYQWFI